MTWSEVRTNWPPLHDQVQGRWEKLTPEDIAAIGGRRHQLVAFLRLRYELDTTEASSQADAFVQGLQVLSL